MNVVFLDAEGLEDCDLSLLREECGQLTVYAGTASDQVIERIGDAEAVILNKVKIDRDVFEASPNLKLICVVATGVDVIDLSAAQEAGVTVCNCQDYGTDSVVQHVFSVLLALHTNLMRYHEAVQNGRWQKANQFCFLDYPIVELKGKTLGIVGYGNLGQGVARIARAFGMHVEVAARPGSADDDRIALADLLPQVDVLTLHCPLTEETRGIIDRSAFEKMKSTAFLINAARGGIVNEEDLAWALKNRIIAGAAVDVLGVEPPREGNVLLDPNIPNLIVTPHIAWASSEARQRIVSQTVENLQSFKAENPIRVVRPK